MLEVEHMASHKIAKHSATKLHPELRRKCKYSNVCYVR